MQEGTSQEECMRVMRICKKYHVSQVMCTGRGVWQKSRRMHGYYRGVSGVTQLFRMMCRQLYGLGRVPANAWDCARGTVQVRDGVLGGIMDQQWSVKVLKRCHLC